MVWKLAITRLRRAVLQLAVVLPLLAVALVPVGTMPGQDADGQAVTVLCSGNGPMLMVLDPVTGTLKQAPATAHKTSCDWAMAQVSFDIGLPFALPLPPVTMTRAAPVTAVLQWRPAHDPRGIWARGPPSEV